MGPKGSHNDIELPFRDGLTLLVRLPTTCALRLLVYIRTYNVIFLSHVVTCARFNCAESNVLTSVVSLLSSRDDVPEARGHDKHFHYKSQFL